MLNQPINIGWRSKIFSWSRSVYEGRAFGVGR